METTEAVREALQVGDWVASVDLTDAYFHIPIRVSSRKYLRFTHRGVVYQYQVLPFGICTAPLIFTLVMREVRIMLQKRDVDVHMYIDDWLIVARNPEKVGIDVQVALDLCRQLGLRVNLVKSELTPTQECGPRRRAGYI